MRPGYGSYALALSDNHASSESLRNKVIQGAALCWCLTCEPAQPIISNCVRNRVSLSFSFTSVRLCLFFRTFSFFFICTRTRNHNRLRPGSVKWNYARGAGGPFAFYFHLLFLRGCHFHPSSLDLKSHNTFFMLVLLFSLLIQISRWPLKANFV